MWLMTAMAAWATPVAFQVSATVGRVDDPSGALSGSVQVGDTITMTYTYDTDTANTGSVPTVGDYWHDGPPYGMRVDAGPVSFATDPMATSFLVEFVNDHGNPGSDNYLLRSYANVVSRGAIASPVDHMSWQLDDSTMRALSSTALTTRPPALPDWTTHPFFMARFNDLLGNLGIRAHLINPYRHKTKGEMVRECQNQDFLADNAQLTMSCSSPTKGRWKHLASAHCGHCVPCLIRKAAFVGWQKGDNTQ
ncbi:MAG TPA: hypothetical protein PKA64_12615, partial [Myxococcota bacterium]|nr:hypothetical protein [Myxococcota bacterium]